MHRSQKKGVEYDRPSHPLSGESALFINTQLDVNNAAYISFNFQFLCLLDSAEDY